MTQSAMPPPQPLAMPPQDLRAPVPAVHDAPPSAPWLRAAVFGPAVMGTAGMLWALHVLFAAAGHTWLEYVLLGLIGATFFWVSLSVFSIAAGLFRAARRERLARNADPINVALLVPIYNEDPGDVFGNAAAMLADLARQRGGHRYSFFILSDTRDNDIAAAEWHAFQCLPRVGGIPVHYRRRAQNTDKKVGNIADWVTAYGGGYEAMLVLDADSLMSGQAIARLAAEMAADPEAGLIQTCPRLIGAETLFARIQQFSNLAYGGLLAEGLAEMSRTEGNYWGHNAIIRTRAFAACAGLPYVGRGQGDLILSHDFVEASLLRRAGWRVRFLPRISGSFEEVPGTLIDFVTRDARWCRGNLQHLRLLGTRGLHPLSRFHLFQGAASYLMSPAWFILLVFWALLGRDAEANVLTYFNEANPLFPSWPPEMTHMDSAVFLLVMYAVLLLPKLVSVVLIASQRRALRRFGGARVFVPAVLVELALSIAYAPVLMVQQTKAVLRSALRRGIVWTPQQRVARGYPLSTLVRFHWVETILGAALFALLIAGLVSWWLVPIALSLTLAVPLSALSAVRLSRAPIRLENPVTLQEPLIVAQARKERSAIRSRLDAAAVAAE
ncbi:MAG: glucans biosynthesis glucosyltransferase MdoH [Pseudomonadota bacterium]